MEWALNSMTGVLVREKSEYTDTQEITLDPTPGPTHTLKQVFQGIGLFYMQCPLAFSILGDSGSLLKHCPRPLS